MGLLTRDQILEADDITAEEVAVPEWGGSVMVRHLSASQMERIQERMQGKGIRGVTAALAAAAIVDEGGKRLFNERDIDALGKKSIGALNRVLAAIKRMNAIDQKELDELAKNSADGQDDDLLSD